MKPILIFRHWPIEGPGYIATFLTQQGQPWRLVAIDAGDELPTALTDVAGLIFMGGPMSVNDPLTWIQDELELIRIAHNQGLPILGHCLGGQLIARALGGSVAPNAVKEIGWLPVMRLDNPIAADWLHGLPQQFDAFHWHGETFTIPEGATPILTSTNCLHQGFVMNQTLALQCHMELTVDMVTTWVQDNPDELIPSASVQSASMILTDLSTRINQIHLIAERIYQRWLTHP